ncbi:RNA polymerase sigma factor [Corallincola platygyrae]|uniref:RNA polymerase sigma factor n=1 Tax=Corallincola platygyrae TaxID=1193278 RepID=A0ABW4XND6_9GAMM
MQFDATLLNRLFRYGFAFTMQREAALDLVQQACEKALKQPPDDKRKLEAYLKVIVRRLYLDGWRQQQQYPLELFTETEVVDDEASIEQLMVDQQQLSRLMPMLSPQQRELIYLWAVEGWTIDEIAEQLGEPRGTLLARLRRVREQLSRLPEESYGVSR